MQECREPQHLGMELKVLGPPPSCPSAAHRSLSLLGEVVGAWCGQWPVPEGSWAPSRARTEGQLGSPREVGPWLGVEVGQHCSWWG